MATAKELDRIEAEIREKVAYLNLPPCQRGYHCVWAKDTRSNKITCLWTMGCVKAEGR